MDMESGFGKLDFIDINIFLGEFLSDLILVGFISSSLNYNKAML